MIATDITTAAPTTQAFVQAFDIRQAIDEHMTMAKRLACRAYRFFGRHFDFDDLLGYGHLGLVRGCHQFAQLPAEEQAATDLEKFLLSRIWNTMAHGKDAMCTIGRRDYAHIRSGAMERPEFLSGDEEFQSVGNIPAREPEASTRHMVDAGAMLRWLRFINPLLADIVELRSQGLSYPQIGRKVSRSQSRTCELYQRGMKDLHRKFVGR